MESSITDGQLVEQTLIGSKEAYAVLVNRYKHKVYGLLRGNGLDRQDAQDLTQETFLKAYRNLVSHAPSCSFAAWLYTIALNTLRDNWKRQNVQARVLAASAEPSYEPGPEETVLKAERDEELYSRIMELPENYRRTLLLRYTNDLSYEEIAELMGVPASKVQNDLYRAKLRLRQMLAGKGVLQHVLHD